MAAYEGLAVGPLSAHNVPDCGRACALHLPRNAACFYRKQNKSFSLSGSDLLTEKSVHLYLTLV
jgi:hypothetical protein